MKVRTVVNKLWAFVPIKPLSDLCCFAGDLQMETECLVAKLEKKKKQAIDVIYHDFYDEE